MMSEILRPFNKTSTSYNRHQSTNALMHSIHEYIYTLWFLRNKHCHKGLCPGSALFIRSTLFLELQTFYDDQNDMLSSDHDLFAVLIEQHTKKKKLIN